MVFLVIKKNDDIVITMLWAWTFLKYNIKETMNFKESGASYASLQRFEKIIYTWRIKKWQKKQ